MADCIFIKSARLFNKLETFVSEITWEPWVQHISTGRIRLIRGRMTVEGDQDTWDTAFVQHLL